MRKALGLLLFCIAAIACKAQKPTYKETVIKYYNARDTGNYNRIKNVITDSITIIAGDYVMPYDKASFGDLGANIGSMHINGYKKLPSSTLQCLCIGNMDLSLDLLRRAV